jgi:c(7)-type cytochrome triheme protein
MLCVRVLAGADKAPDKLTFESKMGNVTFDHKQHAERAESDCTVCHDKLFSQSRAPLNFKAGMHKPAEAKKESCAGCHHEGGQAFATKGNCKNCHVK